MIYEKKLYACQDLPTLNERLFWNKSFTWFLVTQFRGSGTRLREVFCDENKHSKNC